MTNTAGIYCRISRDPDSDRLGVTRQQKACQELCERNGWTVAAVFEDDDVSAYSGKARPAYQRMMADLEAGRINTLVAWAPDRFTRSTRELDDLIDAVEKAGATVATVQAGMYDLSTPSGRMSARVVGSVARYESEHKSERIRAKVAELAAAGKVAGGGTRCFGFEADRITHNPAEVGHVGEAARRVIEGDSLRSICADWNARGVSTVTGAKWSPQVLRTMLTSARIAGKREYKGTTTTAVWAPVIDETSWAKLRVILLDPDRRKNGGRPSRRLLTGGLLRCGVCGAAMVSRPRGDGRPCYVCAKGPSFKGCGKIRVLGEPIDELVGGAVLIRLEDADLRAHLADPGAQDIPAELVAEVARLETEIDGLAGDFADGRIGRDAYAKATARFEAKLTDARREITATVKRSTAVVPASVDLASWPTMPAAARRDIIAAIAESVTVSPAVAGRNYFDPSRVSIVWR